MAGDVGVVNEKAADRALPVRRAGVDETQYGCSVSCHINSFVTTDGIGWLCCRMRDQVVCFR